MCVYAFDEGKSAREVFDASRVLIKIAFMFQQFIRHVMNRIYRLNIREIYQMNCCVRFFFSHSQFSTILTKIKQHRKSSSIWWMNMMMSAWGVYCMWWNLWVNVNNWEYMREYKKEQNGGNSDDGRNFKIYFFIWIFFFLWRIYV